MSTGESAEEKALFSRDIAGHSVVHHWNRLSRYRLSLLCARGTTEPWPERTEFVCWHCTEPFETQPVGVPVRINAVSGEIVCDGNFCSYSCALTYTFSSHATYQEYKKKQMLMQVAREVHGITAVCPAPPTLALRKFGGPLSIEEFRSTATEHAMVVNPPFVCQGIVYEERRGDDGPGAESGEGADAEESPPRDGGGAWTVTGLAPPSQPLPLDQVLSDSESFGPPMFEDFVQRQQTEEQRRSDYGGELGKFIKRSGTG